MWNSRNLNGLRLRRNTSESGGVIKRNQARSVLCLQMVICLPFKRKIVLVQGLVLEKLRRLVSARKSPPA